MSTGSGTPAQSQTRRHSFAPSAASNGRDSFIPPAYNSGRSGHRSRRRHSQQPLPAYAQATALEYRRQFNGNQDPQGGQTQEHEFHITSDSENDGRPWATMRLFTRSSTGSSQKSHYPRYFGGDAIAGTVELDLDKSQTINSITLTLKGRFMTRSVGQGSHTFLNQTFTVWNKNVGEPRSAVPSSLDIASSKKNKFNAKLQGKYEWPFSFPFPTEICLPLKGGDKKQLIVQTPQTFLERTIIANIQYDLVMTITHGLFRPNSKLATIITYTPSVTPPPPSLLRQQAYQHGGFLLPPSEDPQGWHTFPSQPFSAQMNSQHVDLLYSLSLTTPLSYTRGTVLPCFLKLHSTIHAPINLASLLMDSSNPFLSLVLYRKVAHLEDSLQAPTRSSSPFPGHTSTQTGIITSLQAVGTAVWWRPPSNAGRTTSENQVCYLEGEIHLSEDLQPTTQAGFFSVEYFVTLMASTSPTDSVSLRRSSGGFTSQGLRAVSDLLCPVQIATFHMTGPLPTPFTPPKTGKERNRSNPSSQRKAKLDVASEADESGLFSRYYGGFYYPTAR
ncbi:hypothetical protein CC2G_010013 [Coprinopsis cinerea AmutBmut pab1-1]|nr:hypothetical protein CC2G_010013 [Coprinopsis cinerea AmutBmut pab1-1]